MFYYNNLARVGDRRNSVRWRQWLRAPLISFCISRVQMFREAAAAVVWPVCAAKTSSESERKWENERERKKSRRKNYTDRPCIYIRKRYVYILFIIIIIGFFFFSEHARSLRGPPPFISARPLTPAWRTRTHRHRGTTISRASGDRQIIG